MPTADGAFDGRDLVAAVAAAAAALLVACSGEAPSGPGSPPGGLVVSQEVVPDPGGHAPLTARIDVETPPLSPHLPDVSIDVATPSEMLPGMTLVSYYGHDGDPSPNRNGHLYFGAQQGDLVYEVDMLGRVRETWEMPGFGFHHQVKETSDGDFLVTVHRDGIGTIEDHVIEIDRGSGQITDVWDLRQSLDPDRTTWTDDRTDWVHVNAVAEDERDGGIIVSGRTQGVVKLTRDNEVVWILAPHRGWDTAGDGTDLSQRLLQPPDAAGQPITSSTRSTRRR